MRLRPHNLRFTICDLRSVLSRGVTFVAAGISACRRGRASSRPEETLAVGAAFKFYQSRAARDVFSAGQGCPGSTAGRDARRYRHPSRQSGVALVVTIIMISVITFLTIAFLALSGREKGATKTATDQVTARLEADRAMERAKVELLAGILASRNPNNFDFLVSTNFINWNGFDPSADDQSTNVNFEYLQSGAALNVAQYRQNLTNLLYNPRPPVFITNRAAANSQEFRYYLDLNRNGKHDRSGWWPVTNGLGQVVYQPGTNFLFLSNYVSGDPEWIGSLNRPDRTHSADNFFGGRSAYAAIPVGKTLDVNYIHNQALAVGSGNMDGNGGDYFRNQGVGGWELNLAAFLYDLNTNNFHGWGGVYTYNPLTGFGPSGNAFADAGAIYRYRLNGNPNVFTYGLPTVTDLYGVPGANAFNFDFVDGYSANVGFPFSTNGIGLVSAGYLNDPDNVGQPWVGAEHANAFFTIQDLFDRTKTSTGTLGFKFADRLEIASTNLSTYDQYTYYRLLSQLGTDSAPEDPGKLHLNYVNVGGLAVTNYVPWTDTARIQNELGGTVNPALLFFTNAVDRMLREYSTDWLARDFVIYTNRFRTEQIITLTNIPVIVSNQFVYSPGLHRILQLAANIWDTKPNARALDPSGPLPTVFRPQFVVRDENIYINGFTEEKFTDISIQSGFPAVDLLATNNPAAVILATGGDALVYGVPPVVGARKGLPNFNEFQIEPIVSLTRKLQLRKVGRTITETNQFFTMTVLMPQAVEFWNSYATNFPEPVIIRATNFTTMIMTNDLGVSFSRFFTTGGELPIAANGWPRYKTGETKSFVVMNRTNLPLLPTIGYLPGPSRSGTVGFVSAANESVFDDSQNLVMPRWGITISNRVQAMILRQSDRAIMDYVVLGNMVYTTNITDIMADAPTGTGDPFTQLWATNALPSNPLLLSGQLGIIQQINISLGAYGIPPAGEWESFGTFSPSTAENEIAKFRNLYYNSSTNGFLTVPYTPTYQFRVPMIWQANDPLVHYMSSDLLYVEKSGVPTRISPVQKENTLTGELPNIGQLNERYKPWSTGVGGDDAVTDPDATNLSLKDPLVTSSDEWLFPTNTLPTVGWLGRIHRGTPWQTVYLKSPDLGLTNRVNSPTEWAQSALFNPVARQWANWSGNPTLEEGFYNRPVADRLLFDVFTTTLNDNAARGRLPINQSGLASWSALFSGMVVLTNDVIDRLSVKPRFRPMIIEPAGVYNPFDATDWPPLVRLVESINATRGNTNLFPNGTFNSLGDLLSVPELTVASPFLNVSARYIPTRAITDSAYEWLPQQMMSLVQLGEPRFVIYAYGQALQPAPNSILVGGAYSGLCTNYTITAEVAARAVVRVEGSPNPQDANHPNPKKRYPPRVIVESYNYLPPD
jgi:hypothetical protein